MARLNANACVLERFQRRQSLREKPGLNLFGDFQLLGGVALGFQSFSGQAPLRFQFPAYLVEAHQGKRISIEIAETSEHAAPDGLRVRSRSRTIKLNSSQTWSIEKTDSPAAPFMELPHNIFG